MAEEVKLRKLTDKEHLMVAALPRCGWSVEQAGLEAGYKASYASSRLTNRAKHDVSLCKAIAAKREETQALAAKKQGWTLEGWQEEIDEAIEFARSHDNAGALSSLLSQKGRTVGAFAEDNSQKGQTARQITIIMPDQQKREQIPSTVVEAPTPSPESGER